MAQTKKKEVSLPDQWKLWKHAEDEAKLRRLAVEKQIIKSHIAKPPETGTVDIDGQLGISFALDRKWDQEALLRIYNKKQANEPFPFKLEFSEIRAETKYLEEHEPEIYAAYAEFLTVKPKKPSFKAKG